MQASFSFTALVRALKYMLKHYGLLFAVVVLCVIVSAAVTAYSVLFSQALIDGYIEPMLTTGSTDFSGLARDLMSLGAVLALGVLAAYAYNRLMVTISQGTMRSLRVETFEHMESLPIKYFDTHAHGDIMPINANIGNISYVLVCAMGAAMALGGVGGLTIGALVSFITLNRNFSQPITQVSQQMSYVTMAAAGAERVFALMDEQPEEDHGYVELVNARELPDGSVEPCEERTGTWAWRHPHHDGTVSYVRQCGELVMDGVDFGYTPDKLVLHDVSLHAEPGQKIAFVGSTGAGKTTITNLINRFYDIDDGKIRYDGINVNKIKKGDLRRSLGIVLQDTHLFTGTVMDNIRYGRLEATDDECVAAAKLAGADGFIRRLPEGYQTVISGDGASLSQGQCQLLAIARAAVADPPALILDEATSSIDTRTEELVQAGMDRLMAGRTTFVIAHRLSTVKNADCICVMEQGRIIERGNHDELIAQRGRYWQLYTGGNVGE